ncbi:MAG TPA: ABC transporter ATP-binding protein, partial [Caldimonas sp.]
MTPDLMRAGADTRRHAEERAAALQTGSSGGRVASYSRVVQPGQLDIAHGAILYLDDITVSFDGFKALNAL